MRCSVLFLAILSAVGVTPATFGQGQPVTPQTSGAVSPVYDRASFTGELRRIADLLRKKPSKNEMATLRDALPKRWTVSTPEGSFSISSEPLRNQLTSLSSEKAQAWVTFGEVVAVQGVLLALADPVSGGAIEVRAADLRKRARWGRKQRNGCKSRKDATHAESPPVPCVHLARSGSAGALLKQTGGGDFWRMSAGDYSRACSSVSHRRYASPSSRSIALARSCSARALSRSRV